MPGFSERCRVMADLSKLSGLLQAVPRKDGTEGSYYRIDFKVCLFVAENSLNAKLEWVEGVRFSFSSDLRLIFKWGFCSTE